MISKQLGIKLSALTLALILAGCGGGGSDGYYNNGGSSSGNTGGSQNGIETPEISKVNISKVEIFDQNSVVTNTVTTTGATARVLVTDQNQKPISGALVTFTSENISFSSTNGAVLTDVNGTATIALKPTDDLATGAYKISASVEIDGNSAQSAITNFIIGQVQTKFSDLTLESSTIDAGASVKLHAKTVDKETDKLLNNIKVNVTAECGTFSSNQVNSNQGLVETTYIAISEGGQLCTGTQKITLSANNGAVTSSINVNINSIKANSISYSSGTVKLGTINSGSSSSGKVEFIVYSNNVPARNQDVSVELVYGPNDLSFVSLNNRTTKIIKSNEQGKVVVDIFPGSIPGPVEIKATLLGDTQVTALSKDVSIATGRVTQNGLSLSVSKNALQWDVDGDKATIIARLRDRVGNKVPDGTVVSFVTEGGSITPNCSTIEGECSVVLQTQNPRPADNRVTVLAYVEGDKTYVDKNSDNLYTAGIDELTNNIGDFFRDDNENTIFEAALGEFLYKRGAIGTTCVPSTFKHPNIAGTCDAGLEAVIREQLVFAFSHDVPTITDEQITNKSSLTFKLFGNSAQSVPMPTGTTVALEAEDNTKTNEKSCSTELWTGSNPVASVFNLLTPTSFKTSSQVNYNFRLKECDSGDSLILTVTAPTGQVTKQEYVIR